MNWHYGDPIIDDEYLCCVAGYDCPMVLMWDKDRGGWGQWTHGEFDDGLPEWTPFVNEGTMKIDSHGVVCYTSFGEIPMPENW
jgi:hypothetical protein